MSLLAIIIPYYKIDFFEETLKSVEAQTCKDFNLYIGNDASPKNPEKLISDCLKETQYQYVPYSENIGGKCLASQWERILNEIKDEEWFLILGDDDTLAENFVEAFYNNLSEINKAQSSVVKTKQRWIDEENNAITEFSEHKKLVNPYERLYGRSSLSEHIFKVSMYKKYGFKKFPLAWKTDNLAVIEFSNGKPVYFMDDTYVNVRISSKSISGQEDKNQKEKKMAVMQYEKYVLNNYYNKLEKAHLKEMTNNQILYKYRYGINFGVNIPSLFLYLKDYKSLLKLPKTYYDILKNKKIDF